MTPVTVLLIDVTYVAVIVVYVVSIRPRWERFCKRKGEEAVERIRRAHGHEERG